MLFTFTRVIESATVFEMSTVLFQGVSSDNLYEGIRKVDVLKYALVKQINLEPHLKYLPLNSVRAVYNGLLYSLIMSNLHCTARNSPNIARYIN